MAKIGDLSADEFPPLDWEPTDITGFLDAAYRHVVGKAKAAQVWYLRKKNAKRILGFYLRLIALGTATFAGILPILSEMFERENHNPYVSPGWAAILLAVTGLCILLDKFGGYTSGWVRYVLTSQQIGQQLDDFQFQWQRGKMGLAGRKPTYDEARQLLTACHEFAGKITVLVIDETKQWASEFESALKLIEAAAKEIPKPETTGAINITVTNGEKVVGAWTLQIDGATPQDRTGKRAALRGLRPGLHVIHVAGRIAGNPVSDEQPVKILAGEIVELELELQETP